MGDREAPGMPGETAPLTYGEALIVFVLLGIGTVVAAVLVGLLAKLIADHWPL